MLSNELACLFAGSLVVCACASGKPAGDFDAGDANLTPDAGVYDGASIDGSGVGTTCDLCENNSDCESDHQCVQFGGEWACLPRCNALIPDCPQGFVCGGVEITFCAPQDGVCCVDHDNDSYGHGFQCDGDDCDDEDVNIHPGMPDICNDEDDDCDTLTADGSNDVDVGVDCDGDDLDLCEEGTTYCEGGEVLCSDTTGDAVDMCNGVDDDCNPATLDGDGDPAVSVACDSTADADLCNDDVTVCNSAVPEVQCQDLPGGPLDLCDGADNDCNPATADGDGDPGVGLPCDGTGPGGDDDLCEEGTTYCSGGNILCNDPNDVDLDVCDGADNDCNPSTPDGSQDPDVGVACDGTDGDLCLEGVVVCAGGFEQCSDTTGTNAEICNGVDDNCMDGVDEMDPNVSCPAQYPGAQNVASWGCSDDCIVLGCSGDNGDIDGWVANGCECGGLDTHASACGSAVPRSVSPGSSVSVSGKIDTATGSDWLRFEFANRTPPATYHPRVRLTANPGGQFAMSVYTSCTAVATCGDGDGAGITVWEGTWSYTAGDGCCSDTFPHVTRVYVRVSRAAGDAPTCDSYTVEAANL